jgi:pimeloyl-ACP methyl ester carboxylesterase
VQEIWLPVGDGIAEGADARVVVACGRAGRARRAVPHGVRWNSTGHLNRMSQLRRFGFSVFAIDYRGFGKSDGELPSEATVYEDARAGWKWVVDHRADASRRYIYGHSLGGAVAGRSGRECIEHPASAPRAHRRIVVHVIARARVGIGLRLAADRDLAEIRIGREDRAGFSMPV